MINGGRKNNATPAWDEAAGFASPVRPTDLLADTQMLRHGVPSVPDPDNRNVTYQER